MYVTCFENFFSLQFTKHDESEGVLANNNKKERIITDPSQQQAVDAMDCM